jgi:hypothetical protein
MKRLWIGAVLVLLSASVVAQTSSEEKAVWKLEHQYWEYVKVVDLDGYRSLWHPNFVGWPLSSAEPARKDHITDWIKLHSDKGEQLQSYSLKEAGSQLTDNVVVTHYWLTSVWGGKNGAGSPQTMRITHTWIRVKDGWQIIGGMSAPSTLIK